MTIRQQPSFSQSVRYYSDEVVIHADTSIGFDATGLQNGTSIYFSGRSAVDDGGGGLFHYYTSGAQAVDNGIVYSPTGGGRLIRNGWTIAGFIGPINCRWFGSADNAAVQAAINAAETNGGGTVKGGVGVYSFAASCEIKPGVFIEGEGEDSTEFKALGDFPVFTVSGSIASVKNRGGVSHALIRGGGKANVNAYGIKASWTNRYRFKHLRFHGCRFAMYASNVWQDVWESLDVDGGGTDQNYIGFYMAEVDPANQNNAVRASNCVAQNCEQYNWRLINFNGSKFVNCEGAGTAIHSWYLGAPTVGTEAIRWGHFTNCLGDSNSSDNWKIEKGAASAVKQVQFTNCWAGNSTGGHGFNVIDASQLQFNSPMTVESNKSGIQFLRCSRITVSGEQILEYDGAAALNGGVSFVDSTFIEMSGGHVYTTKSAAKGIVESGTSDNNLATGNYIPGFTKVGANSRFMRNNGAGGERSGSAQITAAATSVTVTHNMEFTPSINDVRITPRDSMGSATKLRVQNMTATTFDIACDVAPGSTITIAWAIDPIGQ